MQIMIGKRTVLAKTCTKCFTFKQARDFQKYRGGYTQGWCKRCQKACKDPQTQLSLSAASQGRARRRTQDKATKVYDRWSANDLNRLKQMFDEGVPREEIAYKLGRTLSSILNTYRRYFTDQPQR